MHAHTAPPIQLKQQTNTEWRLRVHGQVWLTQQRSGISHLLKFTRKCWETSTAHSFELNKWLLTNYADKGHDVTTMQGMPWGQSSLSNGYQPVVVYPCSILFQCWASSKEATRTFYFFFLKSFPWLRWGSNRRPPRIVADTPTTRSTSLVVHNH